MPQAISRRARALVLATLPVAAATLLRIPLEPWLGGGVPFLFLFPAVLLSAWIARAWGAALAPPLSGLAAVFFVYEPSFSTVTLDPHAAAQIGSFLLLGWLIGGLIVETRKRGDAIEERDRELARQNHFLSQVVDTAPAAIVTTDASGSILTFNRECERVTGFSRAEVHGKNLVEFFVPEEWRETVVKRFQEPAALDPTRPHDNPWSSRSGEPRLMEWRCQLFQLADGQSGVLGTGTDVTEKRAFEKERAQLFERERQLRGEAQRELALKDQFITMVSHEFRTPLTSIHGWADLLAASDPDPALIAQGMGHIRTGSRTLLRLVDELLELSRVQAGELQVEREPFDVGQLAHSVAEELSIQAQDKGLQLRVFVDDKDNGSTRIESDPHRMRQILNNLLYNAIRYTDQGGIELRVVPASSQIEITVADTGRGISPEFLPSLFQPFTRESREPGGTGIGLSVVKRLVELLDGHVTVASELGRGTRFSIVFPAAGRS